MFGNNFKDLHDRVARDEKLKAEERRIVSEFSAKTENEVLVHLWTTLGDHTPTYFNALKLAGAFVEIHKAAFQAVHGFSHEQSALLFEATAKLMLNQAECFRQCGKAQLAVMHETPLKGDFE